MFATQMSHEQNHNERTPTSGNQYFENAQEYLDHIRIARPDVYDDFLKIMKDLYIGKMSTADATARVGILFNGDVELMQRFESFLP